MDLNKTEHIVHPSLGEVRLAMQLCKESDRTKFITAERVKRVLTSTYDDQIYKVSLETVRDRMQTLLANGEVTQ